jgi:hypothetical protein
MKVSQQIVSVNQRLGNTAVPNMQGTTRMIFDTVALTTAATDQTLNFYSGVSSRTYPAANISSNRFEVGESLAIQGFSVFTYTTATPNLATTLGANVAFRAGILNFYIGNQRIIKDLEIVSYSRFGIGEAISETVESGVFRLETPIVIPPQVEFYATLRIGLSSGQLGQSVVLATFGTGTLLNTKSNF